MFNRGGGVSDVTGERITETMARSERTGGFRVVVQGFANLGHQIRHVGLDDERVLVKNAPATPLLTSHGGRFFIEQC